MKRLIRWTLNHVPRPLLQRLAGWSVPLVGLLYRGKGRQCPVCGAEYRRFLPYGYVTSRADALCPHCLSLERHRLLWLWLTHETDLMTSRPRLLHIAPEVCLMRTCAGSTPRRPTDTSRPTSKVRWPTCTSTCSRSRCPTTRSTW